MNDIPIEVIMPDGVQTLVITLNIIIRRQSDSSSAVVMQSKGNDPYNCNCPFCEWKGQGYKRKSDAMRAFDAHIRQMHQDKRGVEPLITE